MARSSDKTRYLPVGQVKRVIIVGCGGTGSIMAEHICRMVSGFRLDLQVVLFDGDIVEDANITRQNFQPFEVGANKAEALALRLAGQFAMEIQANSSNITESDVRSLAVNSQPALFVTCTDTLYSRRLFVNRNFNRRLWLDAGNDRHHGQAIFGTTHSGETLREMYETFDKKPFVRDAPDIAAMNPAILKARKTTVKAGCASMPFASQGFGVNAMAALAAATIAKQILVDGQVRTPAIYFNVSDGRMQARTITKDLYNPWKKKKGGK